MRLFQSVSKSIAFAFVPGWLVVVCLGWTGSLLAAQQSEAERFERKIRPLLLEHCISCHGPDKQESGLRLDTRAGLLGGGDRGPAVQPGQPAASLLLQAVRYDEDLQMPPSGQLNEDQLSDLTDWVQQGANWPAAQPRLVQTLEQRIEAARRDHWSFQPIQSPDLPITEDTEWANNPIDVFVLAKLEQAGLRPSPPVDERGLVRRLYFDLLGLPPDGLEVEKFRQANPATRTADLIDELLNRPQYGEHWARHWLDVARYADTQGYAFQKDRRYPHAYTYRDYVINAFNQDLPFDRFVLEQLAADQLELGDDLRPLAALGFITVGRKFINQHDTWDDQVDVVTRGLMGLTVACARCHDHKYDAIPTTDYYSLQGVFASSNEPSTRPPIGSRAEVERLLEYEQGLQEHQAKHDRLVQRHLAEQRQFVIDRLPEYFYAAVLPPASAGDGPQQVSAELTAADLRPQMIERWRKKIREYAKFAAFRPWLDLQSLPDDGFAQRARALLAEWRKNSESAAKAASGSGELFTLDITGRLDQAQIQSKQDVAGVYAALVRETWQAFDQQGGDDSAILKIAPDLRPFVKLRRNEDSPLNIPAGEVLAYIDHADRPELEQHQQRLDEFRAQASPQLPRAMSLVDRPQPVEPQVLLRGNPNSPGPQVPRQFLAVLSSDPRKPFPENASGRLQLAREIVSDQNPLTARVIVNRVWMHHFGTPLVATPSDFGLRSEEPLHRELLDFLADYLRRKQWSIKSLHRLILNSRTWQQTSQHRSDGWAHDPDNRLYWRANRRRLEWEALRDSLYAVAGSLDLTRGGPAVDMFRGQPSSRRSIYGLIDRQDLPNLLRSFDFASPDQSVAARPVTTVPQQALFLMNGPLTHPLAVAIAESSGRQNLTTSAQRLDWIYQRVLARSASDAELELGLNFLSDETLQQSLADRWPSLVQTLLMTNEFCFYD